MNAMNPSNAVSHAPVGSCVRTTPFREALRGALAALCLALAGCGGSADAPPPPETVPVVPVVPVQPVPVPPTITQQPANVTVTAGQPASFSVAASGDAPITYQWQRNGNAIAGATATTYTITTTVLGDSGATFRAVATNAAGSATSNAATLTLTAAAPVLTITPQPASTSVVAGATATFTVGGTCSSGTLNIRWQSRADASGTFANIAGATAATYAFATVQSDSGRQLQAQLDCGGQSGAASSIATLTVTTPVVASTSLALLPVTGLREPAAVDYASGLDLQADGSYVLATNNRIKRISADLLTISPLAGIYGAGSLDGAAETASFSAPQGIAHDSAGNLYVTDTGNHTVRKITPSGTVSTLAGSAGATGLVDASGGTARFNGPNGIVIGPDGDLYVADTLNSVIRRVTTAGVVTTYAGSTQGYVDGAAAASKFFRPYGIAFAPNGDLYVSDFGNLRVRLIARNGNVAGAVSTVAGNGTAGVTNGAGTAAAIAFPRAIALSGGALYVSDESQLIRRIDLATALVTTFAGTPVGGTIAGNDGAPGLGHFFQLTGMVAMPAGGLLIADIGSIRTVSATGVSHSIATQISAYYASEGVGTLPQLPLVLGPETLSCMLVEPDQSVVVADYSLQLVRRIAPSGAVSLIAGLPNGLNFPPTIDGKGQEARFARIEPLARDAAGVLYLTDAYGVRKIATDGTVSFLAGSPTAFGFADGVAGVAKFYDPRGIAVSSAGVVFIGDNSRIRRIDPLGNTTTLVGNGNGGNADGPIATASVGYVRQMLFVPDGKLWFADGSTLRYVSADGLQVSTLSGVTLGNPGGFTFDSAGTLYYGGYTADNVGGLRMRTAAGVDTLLIPFGPLTLGASPKIDAVQSVGFYGPKQLVLQVGSQLLVATLP